MLRPMSAAASTEHARDLPSISVVVPTHSRPERAAALVASVLQQEALHELVLVLDGPDAQLQAALTGHPDGRLRVLVLPDNVGQSAAREAGARAATGDVVLLLDDDVVLDPGVVLGHARAHAGQERSVVVGHNPVALPLRRRPRTGATWLYAQEYDRAWEALLAEPSLVLDRLWAGHLSLRREQYLGVAGHVWPARYHEDQDLGRRLSEAGLRGCAAPELTSLHHHSRTLAQSVGEARSQGEALALLSRRWSDRPPPDYATRPGPLGLLALLGGPLGRPVALLALCLSWVAGTLHLWSLETKALRAARQVTLRRALKAATASPEPAVRAA
jgi:GT2 family glycosyltransferase